MRPGPATLIFYFGAGRTLADCDVLIGDRISGVVSWRGQQSVARYMTKPVRLHFQMVDADVYAFQFPRAPAVR